MVFEVTRTKEIDRDLVSILRFLVTSYTALGEPISDAIENAERRVRRIEAEMMRLGAAPHQGTLLPELLHDLRCVTKDRAIFYFSVQAELRQIQVLAVFFGGQDHAQHIVKRLHQTP
ncbi:type II toxin-antitoxin system RelE/ParE family toxin [Rhizobium sp. FKL33]|uniref:type II toxin-antitoxin system RelE/ParE family toxin n=1 Tax=Rhizobium sp. FKL33 TaxID=2562307 RepID=UPI0010C15749|nr:type II toxin-antitoxin system RelE/ParE family toxin [Rhizobium sp. FKL33]